MVMRPTCNRMIEGSSPFVSNGEYMAKVDIQRKFCDDVVRLIAEHKLDSSDVIYHLTSLLAFTVAQYEDPGKVIEAIITNFSHDLAKFSAHFAEKKINKSSS